MAKSDKIKSDELLKRIANLVNQNKELKQENAKLQELVEKLSDENEKNKAIIDSLQSRDDVNVKVNRPKNIKFKLATVLFTSIQGFGKISDEDDSEVLMDELDHILIHFDSVIEKYNIEKVKTIGDTFMCVGGIPQKNITNPVEVVLAALEMQSYLKKIAGKEDANRFWNITLGLHTGTVTAGIQGKRKISYDVKGDTVNIASRIEAASDEGKIIISGTTYELVKEFFQCEYYGRLPVKYKSDLDLYQVNSILPELSKDKKGQEPNHEFQVKFGLIQFMDLQEFMLDKLEKELPGYLYYHNVKHTVDVVTQSELIGWAEGCNDEEILLLKTAALFHDAGHTIQYEEHEFHGTQLARKILPAHGYTAQQIDTICDIIMATKLPPDPRNLLQKIICDSDLDYLGRSDFIPVSDTLYDELKAQNKIGTKNDWNKLQIKFISGHQYFTKTAQSLREVNKQMQIERIKSLIIEE